MVKYHDAEWGVPVHNDRTHFEYLLLDTMQAGLSWRTILHKRENFRKAFDRFDFRRISRYGRKDVQRLLRDAGIIRNRLKILSAIENAKRFLEIRKEFGTFDRYIWQFVGGKPIRHRFRSLKELPDRTKESDAMSANLKKRGFRFVGSTICYAYMQGAGMVNDHVVGCFRNRGPSR
ncbi:MAG: DNA-3-methyladenine glycosylase I [Parcubacteria group bacterium Gr01-1014_38]|nr:MAG: DNA-3-methyladenine glycosylase I [Parcubacteria group bacterium Gr01-1014_38]